MKQIEQLLQQTIGLNAEAVGRTSIARAVTSRMRHLHVAHVSDYFELLRGSQVELNALVESVVITETWFFRQQETFDTLAQMATAWLAAHRAGAMNILSAPCATGEEPYSIAIALLEAGIPPSRFRVDAMDISARALASARRGTYGRNSFRGTNLEFQRRHFRPHEHRFRIQASIQQQVNFLKGNVLDPACVLPNAKYDFVFCRNLMIYFDDTTRKTLLAQLHQRLSPAGVLFLGPAEVPLAMAHGFIATDAPHSFACRPAASRSARASRIEMNLSNPQSAPGKPPRINRMLDAMDSLHHARSLADQGSLDKAAAICEAHLREFGASAEAYYILGLVSRSTGAEGDAAEFYRRALYLEPNHYDTLVQWSALSQDRGDDKHSRLLVQRAKRIKRDV